MPRWLSLLPLLLRPSFPACPTCLRLRYLHEKKRVSSVELFSPYKDDDSFFLWSVGLLMAIKISRKINVRLFASVFSSSSLEPPREINGMR